MARGPKRGLTYPTGPSGVKKKKKKMNWIGLNDHNTSPFRKHPRFFPPKQLDTSKNRLIHVDSVERRIFQLIQV
jgi:hypothetical protein